MQNKKIIWSVLTGLTLILIIYFCHDIFSESQKVNLAKCLTEKKVVFYGASWCPHCAEQKYLFGPKATEFLTYFECSDDVNKPQKKECLDLLIAKYPTWIFNNATATQIGGIASLAKLAKVADCNYVNPF